MRGQHTGQKRRYLNESADLQLARENILRRALQKAQKAKDQALKKAQETKKSQRHHIQVEQLRKITELKFQKKTRFSWRLLRDSRPSPGNWSQRLFPGRRRLRLFRNPRIRDEKVDSHAAFGGIRAEQSARKKRVQKPTASV